MRESTPWTGCQSVASKMMHICKNKQGLSFGLCCLSMKLWSVVKTGSRWEGEGVLKLDKFKYLGSTKATDKAQEECADRVESQGWSVTTSLSSQFFYKWSAHCSWNMTGYFRLHLYWLFVFIYRMIYLMFVFVWCSVSHVTLSILS